jgi:UDP-N-acetylglucosamine:LPS N-acetylglucosamine transferase
MILDQELNGQILSERIRNYVSDRSRIERMASAARAMGRPQAAARIVDECYVLLSQN